MALPASVRQWLAQQGGLVTYVDIETNGRAVAYKLVPCSHYHNHQKFPIEVERALRFEAFRVTKNEGLEYYLVPDETSINSVGTVSPAAFPEEPLEQVETKAPPAAAKYLKRETKK